MALWENENRIIMWISTIDCMFMHTSNDSTTTHLDWLMCSEMAAPWWRRSWALASAGAFDWGTRSRLGMHGWRRSAAPAHTRIFLSTSMLHRVLVLVVALTELSEKRGRERQRDDWLTFRLNYELISCCHRCCCKHHTVVAYKSLNSFSVSTRIIFCRRRYHESERARNFFVCVIPTATNIENFHCVLVTEWVGKLNKFSH